ncbi:MAG: sensor histidine kinase [Cellulosilyticaceae bacterium]
MSKRLKCIGIGFAILIMMLGLSILTSYVGYGIADRIHQEQIQGLVGSMSQVYPDSDVVMAKSLKQVDVEDVARGRDILSRYGYEEKFLELNHSRVGFVSLMKANIVCVGVLFGIGAIVTYGIYRWLKSRLDHLQGYLKEMTRGNYSLNIDGVGEGKFSVFEDEIYKTTLALREAKEKQEQEKCHLARSLADISHQLKTPLTSMGIMTELLLDAETDDQNQLFIQQINKQIERLGSLVSILLKLAKLDSGTVQFKMQKVPIGVLVEEVLDMLEANASQKQIRIVQKGNSEQEISVDKEWFYEALHNIIYNAMQHSPVGGKLTITWQQNPIYTEILVQDEGPGICEEDIGHVFTRFYKGKNASKESIGIGLAMAQTIIEKHEGEVKARNTEQGAVFHIKLYDSLSL